MAEIKDIAELLADKGFIQLQKKRSAFNAFKVLRLKHYEIRHSNVLAWLFKPQESHEFGFAFLEQFLLRLSTCTASEKQKENINHALLLLAQGGMHVSVRREERSKDKKRVDLQIECFLPDVKNKRRGVVILVENKVHAEQGKDQLAEYLNHAEKIFLGEDEDKNKNKNKDEVKIIPVYLTVDEDDEPSGERGDDYFHLTYTAVLEILESLMGAANSDRREKSAGLFIKDYIKTLQELLDMSTEEQEYAKEIYRKYKNVIDFICASGENCITDAGKQFVEQYNQSLEQNKDFKLSVIDKGNAHFFPFTDTVLQGTKGGNDKDWRGGAVCGYFFQLNTINGDDADGFKGTLALKIEVGPFVDSEKRQNLLTALDSKGITYSKGSGGSSRYTRLSCKKLPGSRIIEDVTDVDEVAGKMKELFEETKEMREKLHEGIAE